MSIKTICGIVLWAILLGFTGHSSAQSSSVENNVFPDISGVEKIIWHCDEGATTIVTYIKRNEWWRSVIITEIKIFAVESANGAVRYFTALHGETELHEISAEQYKSYLAFVSPNYAERLRGKPSDCIKL
jgi:hypothetical protein